MDTLRFLEQFNCQLNADSAAVGMSEPNPGITSGGFDPCPDIDGMTSGRILQMLNLLTSRLPADGSECYLEVGTFKGKTLAGALLNNPSARAIACDNFAEFDPEGMNSHLLRENLGRYGLHDQVQFFDMDFRNLLTSWQSRGLPRVGAYLYDAAHDYQSQYDGIRLAEPLLADRAIVVVDDWRYAHDSGSWAEAATMQALGESPHKWKLEHVLPARYNGDRDLWWNGVGLLSFERLSDRRSIPIPVHQVTAAGRRPGRRARPTLRRRSRRRA